MKLIREHIEDPREKMTLHEDNSRYSVSRYGRWLWAITDHEKGLYVRKPGKEDSQFAYDKDGATFLTFNKKEDAQNYIDTNLTECMQPLEENTELSEKNSVAEFETEDGHIIKLDDTFVGADGDILHINNILPEENRVFVFSEKHPDNHIEYTIEDVVKMIENQGKTSEKESSQSYIAEFSKKALEDLPGFPEDATWYASRYYLEFKLADDKYFVTGAKENIDGFVKDFMLEDFIESMNENLKLQEELDYSIYRVTYVVDKADNIFSAVMINARGELEAKMIFAKKFPDTEILGVKKLDDIEVETNKKKGMSLIEDLDVNDELEKQTDAEKDSEEIAETSSDTADNKSVDELVDDAEKAGENPEPPVVGEKSTCASLINELIREEFEAIEQYNTAMINMKELNADPHIIDVLNHIMYDENAHVGNLQQVLKLLAPATDKIEKGTEQADSIMGLSDKPFEEEE